MNAIHHAPFAVRNARATWLAATCLLCLAVACAAADMPEPTPYTLADCVALGLSNNVSLANRQLEQALAGEQVESTRGIYDTRLSLGGLRSHTEMPTGASLAFGTTDSTSIEAALRKLCRRGTRLELKGSSLSQEYEPEPIAGLAALPGLDPDLISSLLYRYNPLHASTFTVSAAQPLLKNAGGRLDRALHRHARYSHAAATHLLERERRLVTARIHTGYWDLHAARLGFRVGKRSLARGKRLLEINRARSADGLLDETDVLAAEAAVATREAQLLELADICENAEDLLKNILRLPAAQWDRVTIVTPEDAEPAVQQDERPEPEAAYAQALANRADLKWLMTLKDQAAYDLTVKEQALRPDLSLVGSVGVGAYGESLNDSLDGDRNLWSVGLQFEVPLARRAEKSAVRQSKLRLALANNNILAMRAALCLECRAATRRLATANATLTATRRAMELHARKLEREQQKFEQGRSSTDQLTRYQDDLEQAEMRYSVAWGARQKAQVQYQTVRGVL